MKKKSKPLILEKKLITTAIENLEAHTTAEILPIVLQQSDHYPAAHFRTALLFSFSTSLIMYYVPWNWGDPVWYLWAQIPALILGYLWAFRPRVKKFFSTSAEINEEVYQKALELFFEYGVHSKKERTGVLLYISLLERRIEIIPDHHVKEKIERKEFELIIKKMISNIKKDGIQAALELGIKELGDLLKTHLPYPPSDQDLYAPKENILSDTLIVDRLQQEQNPQGEQVLSKPSTKSTEN